MIPISGQILRSPRENGSVRQAPLDESSLNNSAHRLVRVGRDSADFAEVTQLFSKGWRHPEKTRPDVQHIFEVLWPESALKPYFDYRNQVQKILRAKDRRGNENLLFHGTNRACLLGESPTSVLLCSLQECSLCSILRTSFDVRRCGSKHSFMRFGRGIYTTACSSKADDYVRNGSQSASLRVMIVACVVIGIPKRRYKNAPHLTEPPAGYHSVAGKTGQDLNYEETVTYYNDTVRPAYLIVYGDKRKRARKLKELLKLMFKIPVVQ